MTKVPVETASTDVYRSKLAQGLSWTTLLKALTEASSRWCATARCIESLACQTLPRTTQLLDIDRASASTADVVSHYFNNPQRVMKKLDLSDKPNRIWNCDETPLSNLLQVTERQNRVLRELDLNVDALNVVNLFSSTAVAPQAKKRKRGDWVDDISLEGSC
ncbi:hypothetical protein KRP22_004122 [Phytophthora ramorum]|nr:hypothetical protein KRP22_13224 [Phytophthora ramorum]